MKTVDICVIGGGPAGLNAALAASSGGASVLLLDDADHLGGQLVKQTHMFFGSEKQQAGTRGIDIAVSLTTAVQGTPSIEVWLETTALGLYDDGVLTTECLGEYRKVKAKRFVVATGASEKMLAFKGNDLPGVYGAGAVQTLMNVFGVKPGQRVLMVGAGNIGLIVSYQLLQAGVSVAAIVEGSPRIGGYLVHASKVRRAGVPILTSHTILEAYGQDTVEGAVICQLDQAWQPIKGTEQRLSADVICLAIGLSPLSDLLWQADCRMLYIPELGGHVAWRDERLRTSQPHIFIAGDVAGIEEASSAMVEGLLAGYVAASDIGLAPSDVSERIRATREQLVELRSGPEGERTRLGLAAVQGKAR
ncbi:MAG: Hydrogen cyanide synthase subunit HcnB [Firmicutes bacterium]|nr:Hydrogen cyanide synthase subunit HcnB [candidate division NPL-UPA2 bacterium]